MKDFSLILRSNLSPNLLVGCPPDTVEVLGLFSAELPLALTMAFRYSTVLLCFSASSSFGEREVVVTIKGVMVFLEALGVELVLGMSLVFSFSCSLS